MLSVLWSEYVYSGTSRSAFSENLKYVGETYNDIGKLFEEQPKHDWEPLGDVMHIYKGILTSLPDIVNLHKAMWSCYCFLRNELL